MNCLIDFLMDENQKKLIAMIQNREETFERALESYKKLFINELEYCLDKENEKEVSEFSRKEVPEQRCLCRCKNHNCIHADSCKNFYKIINEIAPEELKRFFDGIHTCYTNWIDAKTTRALEGFASLLQEYRLMQKSESSFDSLLIKDITNHVLFRARVSDIFLNKLEVFHVPFNKRYYIRNERFSLTGQPVLYLGNSIADLFEELNINYTDSQQLNMFRVASFEFSPDYEYNIFDLRCNIFSHLKNVKNPTFSKKTFFRNILASICSFQKRRELSECAFVEEYVIPQMLAQILKQNGYDGICYFSTKSFEDYSVNSSSNRLLISELNMAYRENYAIFTRMRGEEGYDTVLRDRLEISMPIALSNVRLCGEDDLHELVQTFSNQSKEAKNILSELNDDVTPNLLKKQRADAVIRNCTRAKTIVDSYKYIFGNLKYKNKEYSQTCLGRAQIQLLLGILNRLLAETVTEVEEVTEEIKTANDEMLSEEKVILCNIDGDEIEGADEKDMLYRETHMNGKLHKAIAVFVLHEGDIVLKTDAVSNTFYGHCRNNMLEKFDFAPHKTTTIGSFIYHEFEPVIHNQYGAFISDNFEFVEVVVMKADDILGYPVISIEELKTKFINQYDCFTPFMKQAYPVLFKYLSNSDMTNV